ncbi:hypothetical protein BZG36_03658 [Bifiguratus adelaidae]|uniref:Signal recognition particle receptor subunit beta n=1 Tax=Bifiguratus adelaidae TaxID=1938954 RepID=A0A261XW72_9FUNG|nr:hypothetical protein BZG36_03658 [Bifiguratus adelaidae]
MQILGVEVDDNYLTTRHILLASIAIGVIWALALVLSHPSLRWIPSPVRRQMSNTILLVGNSQSGKTSLFSLLTYGKAVETRTSMKENEGNVILRDPEDVRIAAGRVHDSMHLYLTIRFRQQHTLRTSAIHLVDVPGHEKLRFKLADFTPIAGGVVFIVDSATVSRNARSVAEHLYELLTDKNILKRSTEICIACNKVDLPGAIPLDRIRHHLEEEITRLRQTRTASLEHQDTDAEEIDVFLGYEGQDFSFDHLESAVTFHTMSVENGNMRDVVHWMADAL